jgi:glycosyltransferase involved in cell wall biosynthesis
VKYARTIATQATYWPSLARQLARADVVHVFSASYFSFLLAPLPALAVARLLGRPVVLNYRSGEAPDHLARSAVARTVAARCDRVVVPSSFLREVFGEHGVAARVIPNTVDEATFAFRLRDPVQPNLVSTRNLEPLYNVACTLRVFQRVQARYPDATLAVVGHGSQASRLRRLAADLGLRNVRFAGAMRPGEIWRAYAGADLYIQTPNIDNMPSSVLEAFSSGTPVVSTDAGGVPAIVESGVNGFLAPRNDDAALAAHVLRLLDTPGLAASIARAALRSCERYRWGMVRSEWLALYRELTRAEAPSTARVRHA